MEHVFARWIAAVLDDMESGDGRPEWRLQYWAGGLVDRDREHATSEPAVVVRMVCAECNSGWMSGLEERVKPVLEPMIRGQRVTLNPEQQLGGC